MAGRMDGEIERDDVVATDLEVLKARTAGVRPEFRTSAEDTEIRLGWFRLFADLRRKKNISQVEAAKLLGTTQSAISDIEQGFVEARLSTLQRYARALRCRLDLRLIEEPPALYRDRVFHYPAIRSTPVRPRRGGSSSRNDDQGAGRAVAIETVGNVTYISFQRTDSPLTDPLAERIESAATA
jgi:transcriptional regulator with XRE-family HTH domain